MTKREEITLGELQERIKGVIESSFSGRYWVRAETGEVKIHSQGHCYIDLIEKSKGGGGVTAKVQAVIWASSFRMLKPYFETTTGRALERGLSILVNVQVTYSQVYGMSLVITDIDPAFTIGEQEIIRQKSIMRLSQEGMFEINSSLDIPLLPSRLAVISSEGAAGYRDFVKHLEDNDYGFSFSIKLFPAPLQGDSAPDGIIEQMEMVAREMDNFDILLIIRGGGAAQDLVCFDDYNLAINIAQFPLPVVVAVGHDHDYHIADMVAHTSLKTPTAAAAFIIDLFVAEEQQLIFLSRRVSLSLQSRLQSELTTLDRLNERMAAALRTHYREGEHLLDIFERRVMSASPLTILERGYSLALMGGKKIGSVNDAQAGDDFTLLLSDGSFNCTINSIRDGKKR
ncbi:MAG: exodeoxyribonuclease VII large subunit [Bacteroidetes bacterium HGW-Bacteroidetes-8]|jgi:exodeoxyribonuclease VII large subunit|nr:MAG: exodeoxyribonuclease VII large subunit [Bacteroidetes bacterium HGW-Bacteroidetes-8]